MRYRPARDNRDSEELTAFLKQNGLPSRDISLEGNLFHIYRDESEKMIGCGGLEFYGDGSLMRSIAVEETNRGKSFGTEIVSQLINDAKKQGVKKIYLLTDTAPLFFKKLGFVIVPREAVPALIKNSSEFSTVCPASAVCMELSL